MEYRRLDNLGIEASLLDFGCMRFPTLEDGTIDSKQAEEMLDYAYKNGVNYFDTAYFYHGGESESFTGKVLAKYDRDSFYIPTKLPGWKEKEEGNKKRLFAKQLKGCKWIMWTFTCSMP